MSKLKIGSRFTYNHADWTVLDRYRDYVLLQGDQPAIQRFYTCANVITDGDREDCRPYVTGLNHPETIAFSLEKTRAYFDKEVARLDFAAAKQFSDAKAAKAKEALLIEKKAAISDAKLMLKFLEEKMDAALGKDKAISQLVTDRKTTALAAQIFICERLIQKLLK